MAQSHVRGNWRFCQGRFKQQKVKICDRISLAFMIAGQDRPGRWLVTCDHASNRVPVDPGDLGISPEDMARHIAYDVGAAGLTLAFAAALDSPAICSGFRRLEIDPNRGCLLYTSRCV